MDDRSDSKVRAYVDGANVHKGVCSWGWQLQYDRFYSWLRQKYLTSYATLFIGFISKNKGLYISLHKAGFSLVFKEVIYGEGKAPKGNCDADLILQVVRDYFENNLKHAILVSSDGDYASLVRFLQEKKISCTIISPAVPERCSILLKRTGAPIVYLRDIRYKVGFQKK